MSNPLVRESGTTSEAIAPRAGSIFPPALIALHYGFDPILPPTISREDLSRTKEMLSEEAGHPIAEAFPEASRETISLIRRYHESHFDARGEAPLLIWEHKTEHRKDHAKYLRLEIIGTSKSIAEAVLLKTAVEILREEKAGDLTIGINSVGDRESAGRFLRDLTLYYRRRISELHPPCRQMLRRSVAAMLCCPHEHCKALWNDAPRSLSYLSDPSRQHFREVLEFLETTSIPYEINERLLGSPTVHSHTIFEIKSVAGGHTLALGYRYNGLARRLGFKRDIPGMAAIVVLHGNHPYIAPRFPRPRFYFVQLGFEAKLKSLEVLEVLRKARIPVAHAITRERLGSQFSHKNAAGVPFVLIMGIKEALENTIIVRNSADRSQETVPINELVPRLKELSQNT